MLAALASGCAPVLSAIRIAARQSLNHGDRTATGGSRARRIRDGLMAVEIALAVLLLTGGMLALESYWSLSHVRLGFAPHEVLTATITPPAEMDTKQRLDSFREAKQEVAALPCVESVGATQVPPLVNSEWQARFAIVGRPSPSNSLQVSFARVAGAYFHTMRIPLLKGRYFDERDDADGRSTVVVNEAFAHLFFPDGRALGSSITIEDSDAPHEIVGIVGNTTQRQLEPSMRPLLYVPYSQAPGGSRMTLVVRTTDQDAGLRSAIRRTVGTVTGARSIARVGSLDELIGTALTPHRYPAMLLGAFAALALVLACVGVYGVVAYATAQRTRELGIRIALGAHPASIIAVAMRRALGAIGIGALAGVVVSLWLAKAVGSVVYDAGSSDRVVFIAIPCVLLCVATLAAYLPARRASRVDPLIALRSQ
jgi:putative ABC transport system permease protein